MLFTLHFSEMIEFEVVGVEKCHELSPMTQESREKENGTVKDDRLSSVDNEKDTDKIINENYLPENC